jgi:hypothetical protein
MNGLNAYSRRIVASRILYLFFILEALIFFMYGVPGQFFNRHSDWI